MCYAYIRIGCCAKIRIPCKVMVKHPISKNFTTKINTEITSQSNSGQKKKVCLKPKTIELCGRWFLNNILLLRKKGVGKQIIY